MRISSRVLPFLALTAVATAHSAQAHTAESSRAPVAQVRDNQIKL